MKKIFIILVIFIYFESLFGQNNALLPLQYKLCSQCPNSDQQSMNYTYDTLPTSYTTECIESDYDMRVVTGGTKYHQGIDYKPRDACRGDAILNVETEVCTVVSIRDNGGLKSIALQNQSGTRTFVYLHSFTSAQIGSNGLRSGNFLIKKIDNSNELTIIDMNSDPAIAYAKTPNKTVSYKRYANSTNTLTVQTTNQVNPGAMIAPIGDSGAPNVHLHISLIENPEENDPAFSTGRHPSRSIDPWTVLDHPQTDFSQRIRTRKENNFSGDICEHDGPGNDDWGQIILDYSGNTRNTIEIEVALDGAVQRPNDPSRYSNKCMGQEEVVLGIKNVNFNSDFAVALGSDYESKFIINPIENKTIYPSTMLNIYGSPTKNGMSPFSYRDYMGFHPHDYYFISDFYVRISKSDNLLPASGHILAQFPWDARYPDGEYQMRSSILEVNNPTWQPMDSPIDFNIDNFKPFVVKVGLFVGNVTPGSIPAYYRSWGAYGAPTGSLRLSGLSGKRPSSTINQPITVYAVASESMSKMRAFINNLTGWVDGTALPFDQNDPESWGHQKWEFQFGAQTLDPNICYNIVFEGEDLAGNQLLNLPQPLVCNTGSNLIFSPPYRTGNNSWSNNSIGQGSDWVHKFRINDCGNSFNQSNTDQCITAENVEYSIGYSAPQLSTGNINLSVDANTNGMAFTWKNDAGVIVSHSEDVTNVPAGIYCVEILQDCCTYYDCVEIGTCAIEITETHVHPTIGQNGSIWLAANEGVEPYAFTWSNGANTQGLDNLIAGTYTCTVTDNASCEAIMSITLINCPTISVAAQYNILSQPSACDANDGQFRSFGVGTPIGGTAPYSYHWQSEDGSILTGGPVYSDLGPGQYCLVATDVNGCQGEDCLGLFPQHYPEITVDILPACDNGNGSVTVSAIDPDGGNYDFIWSEDIEEYNVYMSTLIDLSPGTYCVTITSTIANNCTVTKCYEIPAITSDPLAINSVVVNPCPLSHNGSIDLTIAGGSPPFLFDWSDLPIDPLAEDRISLTAGTYSVTVTDYCGASDELSFTLSPLQIAPITSMPGCIGQGGATITAMRGNQPYSYLWSNGATSSSITQINSGRYCVTVSDWYGCTLSNCLDLKNKEYEVEKIGSCDLSNNGSVNIYIHNPINDEVHVFFNNIEIILPDPLSSEIYIPINGLSIDFEYSIDVSIGGCTYSENFQLENQPTTIVFDHYDGDENRCYYDEWCGNEFTGESTFYANANVIYSEAESGLFHCRAPVFCDGNKVDDKHYAQKTVTISEYLAMLTWIETINPALSDYISNLRNLVQGEKKCRKVRYCPADLEVTFKLPGIWSNSANYQQVSPGCYILYCGTPPPIPFCVENLIPDWSVPEGLPQDQCHPVTQNLYQLIIWEDQLKIAFPGFEMTELYLDYINVYRNDPRAICKDITFCENDFSVVGNYNMNTCNYYTGFDGCSSLLYTSSDGDGIIADYYLCYDPSQSFCYEIPAVYLPQCVPGYIVPIYYDFPGDFWGFAPEDEEESFKVISNQDSCRTIRFGEVRFEGRRLPKSIINCQGTSKIIDYDYATLEDDFINEIPTVEYFIDDFDQEYAAYIKYVHKGKSYVLNHHSASLDWNFPFESDESLFVKYFDQNETLFIVAGEFVGKLLNGETLLAEEHDTVGYILKINSDGTLYDLNIIRNLSSSQSLIFSGSGSDIHVVGRSAGQAISVDNNLYPSVENHLVDMNFLNNEGVNVNQGYNMSIQSKIIKVTTSNDGLLTTYLLMTDMGNSAQAQLSLVTINSQGVVVWSENINGYLSENNFDIDYTQNSDLVLGLTYTDSLDVQGYKLVSQGGTDIVLIRYDIYGIANGFMTFGSEDSENMSQLLVDHDMIYFGGEFTGPTLLRTLGRQNLLNLSNSESNVYTSFSLLSDFQSYISNRSKKLVDDSNKGQRFEIFPNPFNNNFTISIKSETPAFYNIIIYDLMGNYIGQSQIQGIKGGARLEMTDINEYPDGIYFIEIQAEEKALYRTRIVKSH